MKNLEISNHIHQTATIEAFWPQYSDNLTPVGDIGKSSSPAVLIDTNTIGKTWVLENEIYDLVESTQPLSALYQPAPLVDIFVHDYEVQLKNVIPNKNAKRIELLARKYANSKLEPEVTARLEILTEEIRHLIPSVSEADIEIMKNLSDKVNELSSFADEMHHKHGLDVS